MAAKLIIDTSAYSAFNRGDKRLKSSFTPNNELLVPLIVIGELRAGFAAGTKQQENEALLRRFLDAPNITPITITDHTTTLFAHIYARLRQTGSPIGTNDMWIAALTFEHDSQLLTLDSDFEHVPDLLIVRL